MDIDVQVANFKATRLGSHCDNAEEEAHSGQTLAVALQFCRSVGLSDIISDTVHRVRELLEVERVSLHQFTAD